MAPESDSVGELLEQARNDLAAAQTLVWAFPRRSGLTRAILPTDLAAGFDRFVTAAVLAGSLVVLAATLRQLLTAAPSAS